MALQAEQTLNEREALKHLEIARDWLEQSLDVLPGSLVQRAIELIDDRYVVPIVR